MIMLLLCRLFYMGRCSPVHGAMQPGTWGDARKAVLWFFNALRRFRVNGSERYSSPALSPALGARASRRRWRNHDRR